MDMCGPSHPTSNNEMHTIDRGLIVVDPKRLCLDEGAKMLLDKTQL